MDGCLIILGTWCSGNFFEDMAAYNGVSYPSRTKYLLMIQIFLRQFMQRVACGPTSPVTWQPGQRLQEDCRNLMVAFGSTIVGGPSIVGLPGVSIQFSIGMTYAMTRSWLVGVIMVGILVVLIAIQYASLLITVTPSMGVAWAEGSFRWSHARIRDNVVSIAFGGGMATERARMDRVLTQRVAKNTFHLVVASIPSAPTDTFNVVVGAVLPAVLLSWAIFFGKEVNPGRDQIASASYGASHDENTVLHLMDVLIGTSARSQYGSMGAGTSAALVCHSRPPTLSYVPPRFPTKAKHGGVWRRWNSSGGIQIICRSKLP
jgi:hypothetical protein